MVDSQIDRLTKMELVRYKQDHIGSLEVVIRNSRVVGAQAGEEGAGDIRYVVSMMPPGASQQGQVEVQVREPGGAGALLSIWPKAPIVHGAASPARSEEEGVEGRRFTMDGPTP